MQLGSPPRLQTHMQSQSPASGPAAKSNCDRRKAPRWAWVRVLDGRLGANRSPSLYIRCAAFRSFRAHKRPQSPTTGGQVIPAAGFQQPDGRVVPSARTHARVSGIEKLPAKSWRAHSIDARMFVLGFDEGAECCTCWGSRNPESLNIHLLCKYPSR